MVPAGHSVDPVRWHGELDALLGRGAAVPDPCPATRCTSCHVRGAAARPIPVATLVTGGREAAGGAAHLSGREAAAGTSMATYTGHWPSGRRSFRKQRTVNPPLARCRDCRLLQLVKASSTVPSSLSRGEVVVHPDRQIDGSGWKPGGRWQLSRGCNQAPACAVE